MCLYRVIFIPRCRYYCVIAEPPVVKSDSFFADYCRWRSVEYGGWCVSVSLRLGVEQNILFTV